MNIYDENGYLNIPIIAKQGAWLNVIISARQRFGKTYGVLKYLLDNDLKHILLRRSTKEAETISANNLINPYKVFEPDYKIGFFKNSNMAEICAYSIDEKGETKKGDIKGLLMSLPQIAHVRGFNGAFFSDLVFDEFIPEKGAYQKNSDGDAFLNAYYTINGNRESHGMKPLRCWLLANANNLNNPILDSLNIIDDIIYMERKNKEYINKDGVLVIMPKGNTTADSRAETAINKQLNKNSDFYNMAVNNTFSYNESPFIQKRSITGMKPIFSFNNIFYVWENNTIIYICRAEHKKNKFNDNRIDIEKIRLEYGWLKRYFYNGLINFADMALLIIFKKLLDIDI